MYDYDSDIDHDWWVDHTFRQYNDSKEELYEDFDDEYLEDEYDEDLEDELDEELDNEDLDVDDIDDENIDDEYAEYLEEEGIIDEYSDDCDPANNLSRDNGLEKFHNTPVPTFPETHQPIKPSFFQRLKKLFRL